MNTNTKQIIHREILAIPGADAVCAETTLQLPAGAAITRAEFSSQGVAVYVLKTIPSENVARKFLVVGTGVEVPHSGEAAFVATVSFPKTAALHVFELLA